MTPFARIGCVSALALLSAGCDRGASDGPPDVRLGDSVCVHCNMIISDERWATATMIRGPRGPEPLLFDDFNCQAQYEAAHAEVPVLTRWSHSYRDGRWLRTADATFILSPNLRTPMGSCLAALPTRDDAETLRADLTGEILSFPEAWRHLSGAIGSAGHGLPDSENQEH